MSFGLLSDTQETSAPDLSGTAIGEFSTPFSPGAGTGGICLLVVSISTEQIEW